MCSTAECKRSVEEAIAKLGGLDIVIANAVCISPGRMEEGGTEEVVVLVC